MPRAGRPVVVARRRSRDSRPLREAATGFIVAEAVSLAVGGVGRVARPREHPVPLPSHRVGPQGGGFARLHSRDGEGAGPAHMVSCCRRRHRRGRGGDTVSGLRRDPLGQAHGKPVAGGRAVGVGLRCVASPHMGCRAVTRLSHRRCSDHGIFHLAA